MMTAPPLSAAPSAALPAAACAAAAAPAPDPAPVAASPVLPPFRSALTFCVDGQDYGVDIRQVREIRCFESPVRVAGAAPELLGLINLRGTIVPVVDLRTRFGVTTPAADGQTAVMVAQIEGRLVGVVVDAVSDVVDIEPAQLRPAPELRTGLTSARLLAVATLEERLVQLIDLGASVAGIGAIAQAEPH
jgi:purine-binding chemotaxis protein CheW